jgi:PAS domain S-box-containing protein
MDAQSREEIRHRYEFIVNTSREFMTLIDRAYCYEAANAAYCRAHSLKLEEIIGRTVADVWGSGAFERVIKSNLDRCFGGEEVNDQVWLDYAGLGPRYMHLTYYPYKTGGEVTHAVVITRDITPQKEAEDRLRLTAERLRQLTKELVDVQEAERKRLSAELHDEAGQALTALRYLLEHARNGIPGDLPDLDVKLGEAIALTATTMDQLRAIAHDLRPPGLEAMELGHTLATLCQRMARQTGLDIRLAGNLAAPLAEDVRLTLYRFVQEALANAAKHAQARRITVQLAADAEQVRVTVIDDGIGFRMAELIKGQTRGIGLLGLEERIAGFGGRLTIQSIPGEGTRLTAQYPLADKPPR